MKKNILLLILFANIASAQILQPAKIMILPSLLTRMDKPYPAHTIFYDLTKNELVKINNSILRNSQIDTTDTQKVGHFVAIETNNLLNYNKIITNDNEILDSIFIENDCFIESRIVLNENGIHKKFIFNRFGIIKSENKINWLWTEIQGTNTAFFSFILRNNYLVFVVSNVEQKDIFTSLTLNIN